MTLQLQKDKTVGDIQSEFNAVFPYLKIDFYKMVHGKPGLPIRQKLPKTALLKNGENFHEGELDVPDTMTVGQLEQTFYDRFRMTVQVARKSGGVWLETSVTDGWTLRQQNEHGRELSETVNENINEKNPDD
jgi:hypothetical protein